MSNIDILIAVDGAKLAEQISDGSLSAGSQASPTSLGAWTDSDVYISMISQHSNVTNDGGASELTVAGSAGDNVRWSITTFGNNSDYTAYLYAGNFNPANAITALDYINIETENYLPATAAPTGGTTSVMNHLYIAQGTLVEPNVKIQYTLSFTLVDNATGEALGYFTWDPFIQVNG
jgi:hypothetical protein